MGKTNGKAIAELANKYSKEVLVQAAIVTVARFVKESINIPESVAFYLAQIAYEKELKDNSYLFASLSDEVES